VWLALSADNHHHYHAAHTAFTDLPAPVFCRFTQAGFLRLLTNSHAMGRNTCTPAQAWSLYEKIFQSLGASFRDEPSGLDRQWQTFMTNSERTSGSAWNDAYLAAFAFRAGIPLVTFDQGFRKFHGLDCRVL